MDFQKLLKHANIVNTFHEYKSSLQNTYGEYTRSVRTLRKGALKEHVYSTLAASGALIAGATTFSIWGSMTPETMTFDFPVGWVTGMLTAYNAKRAVFSAYKSSAYKDLAEERAKDHTLDALVGNDI